MNKMKKLVLALSFAIGIGSGASAQVPVIDGSALTKHIEMISKTLADAERQMQQIEQLQQQIDQLTNIDGLLTNVLGSMTGLNEIASLYNSVEDIRSRASKITDISNMSLDLSLGNFDDLLDNLLDDEVTMGEKNAAIQMQRSMESAGFTSERLQKLATEDEGADAIIGQTAAANATAMAAAQISYEEAGESLARVEGLVGEISNQATLKESVDLNTRMAAETNFMLGSMWRLNAAAGLASGQTGLNLAAEQAKAEAFFDFGGE